MALLKRTAAATRSLAVRRRSHWLVPPGPASPLQATSAFLRSCWFVEVGEPQPGGLARDTYGRLVRLSMILPQPTGASAKLLQPHRHRPHADPQHGHRDHPSVPASVGHPRRRGRAHRRHLAALDRRHARHAAGTCHRHLAVRQANSLPRPATDKTVWPKATSSSRRRFRTSPASRPSTMRPMKSRVIVLLSIASSRSRCAREV